MRGAPRPSSPVLLAAGLCALIVGGCGADDTPAGPVTIVASDYDCRAPGPPQPRDTVHLPCMLDASCPDDLVVGHRGTGGNFSLYTPENGLSAIRLAILLGVDGVEIDVRHTADDKLVVLHDDSLKRTTGVEEDITDMTLAEATAVPLSGDSYPGDFACERIPSFEQVLELARDRVFLIIDTKTSRGDLVAEALQRADMLDGGVISVSNVDTAVAAREAVPGVRVQLRPDDLEEYAEIAPRFARPIEILEIPEREIEAFLPTAAAIQAKVFVDIFGRDADAFGSGNLQQYTEPHAAGADIVQTEFPMWVLRAMDRDHWAELPPHRDLGLDSPLLRR